MKLRLYHYWRSSSSWRVRWAFALKGITCDFVHINLLAGEQKSADHLKRNPLGFVPALEFLDGPHKGKFLAESTAIIEWIEETHPKPTLLPGDAYQRAKIRQLAQIVNAGIQPLQNLQTSKLHSDDAAKQKEWALLWINKGLTAYEKLCRETAGKFSIGNAVTLADLFLIPQCYNALRHDVNLNTFPTINKIYNNALQTETCKQSSPQLYQPAPS